MQKKILELIKMHKKATVIIGLVVLVGGYYSYGKIFPAKSTTRYITSTVTKGTIIASVSATGQTSASNQMDLKPQVSGNITKLYVTNGQEVKAGTAIAKIDSTDAEKAVRDAEVNYKSAQLALAKLVEPADTLSITQSQNALSAAQDAKTSAQEDLKKAYNDGYNNVASTIIDISSVITGIHDILFTQRGIDSYSSSASDYSAMSDAYTIAESAYQKNLADYKSVTLYTDNSTIGTLIDETYNTTQTTATAVKTLNSAIQAKLATQNQTRDSRTDTNISNLGSYTDKMNADLQALLISKNTLRSDASTIASADGTIAEKTQSLAKLQSGADPLDIQTEKLNVQQRANALADAEDKLADYTIRAPYDCIIATLPLNVGDAASSGTTVATIITKQKIAEVTLNEVDVAKAKVGQQATLTFDAIDGLTIAGTVSEIDSVGTISQGVVTYNVKITFDTQDDRVKPGMSVSAAIITNVKQDALLVPSGAVKSKNGGKTIDLYINNAPSTVNVMTGISNDTMTEITNGVKEGDTIVTQAITSSTNSPATTQQGGLRIPGISGGNNRGAVGGLGR